MELSLIPAPTTLPNDLPGILNMLTLDDGSTFGHFNTSHIINSPTNRKRFNESKLKELAASVKEKGVVQPILIRPLLDRPRASRLGRASGRLDRIGWIGPVAGISEQFRNPDFGCGNDVIHAERSQIVFVGQIRQAG